MSDKMECPGCQSYTSTVLARFNDGEPCPYCSLPWEAMAAIRRARRSSADADLVKKYEEAITRATRAEQASARARILVQDLRDALDRFEKGDV